MYNYVGYSETHGSDRHCLSTPSYVRFGYIFSYRAGSVDVTATTLNFVLNKITAIFVVGEFENP